MIAGLEEISRGQVLMDGVDMTSQPPSKRGLAVVFQSYAPYPHMNVRDNMGFGVKTAGRPKPEITQMANDAAAALRLEEYLDRRPKDLFGGQRQWVAIGRAIVCNPTAFLFDEPLPNLDAALRVEMRYEIAKLSQSLKPTMIYVTHEQVEAMTLADRIVVLQDGKIEQIGAPKELYESSVNLFVAQFIGCPEMNILPCTSEENGITLVDGSRLTNPGKGAVAHVGARPEAITISDAGNGQLDGVVDLVEYLGADTFVIIKCGDELHITVRVSGENTRVPGDLVGLGFGDEAMHYFDDAGNAL